MQPRALAIAAVVSLAASGSALAKPAKKVVRPKPACGFDHLPFTPGASWTYSFLMSTDVPPGVYVKDPESVTIKVTEIKADGADTVIKLEESYRKVATATELRCTKDGFQVPLDSFFFFGEPGGGLGITLNDLKKNGQPELPGKPLKAGDELYEDIKATAVRTPGANTGAVMPNAAIELERKVIGGSVEDVESKIGAHQALRIDIELTGRARLDGQPKDREPFNMPAAKATMWMVPGMGIVRVDSSTGKTWQLSEHNDGVNVTSAPPAEPTTAAPGAATAPATPAPTAPAAPAPK